MRLFDNFTETLSEVRRDLAEMSVNQELLNYGYTVRLPRLEDLPGLDGVWAAAEWIDRLNGVHSLPSNPGTSYLKKEELREKFTEMETEAESQHDMAVFPYTYSERLAIRQQVFRVIRELSRDKASTDCYVSIWDPSQDAQRIGCSGVPRSLGYHFVERAGRVHLTHLLRFSSFGTHFQDDAWLALKLLHFVCGETGKDPGRFSQFINVLSCNKGDIAGVF